ncbi:MAG: hypothetical protein K0S18_33 [Anaerocolumna sp.]|jgi:hypothetical protein|nr:hypothetical protein [Anaerocolumna sp.]
MKLEHELLEEYIYINFPYEEYGDLTIENMLTIYDSLGYKSYVLNVAAKNLGKDLLKLFKR